MYKFSSYVQALLAWIAVGIFAVEQEIYLEKGVETGKEKRFYLIGAAWGVNLILALATILRYKLMVRFLQETNKLTIYDDINTALLKKPLLYEILFIGICPFPLLYTLRYDDFDRGRKSDIQTYINTPLFIVCVFIRLYHLFRVLLESSSYMSQRSYRIGSKIF